MKMLINKHKGRFPANLILSHSADCTDEQCGAGCAVRLLDADSGERALGGVTRINSGDYNGYDGWGFGACVTKGYKDKGGASRFFTNLPYCPPYEYEPSENTMNIENENVLQGDCIEVLKQFPDNHFTACVTDPPYGLSAQPDMVEVLTHWLAGDDYKHRSNGFMGKSWDSFVPGPATWREVYRVLKPGATLLCFAGQRTQDLMGVSLRLAGFEVFDCVMWITGQGFPKSHNVSKGIDSHFKAEREIVGKRVDSDGRCRATEEYALNDGEKYKGTVLLKSKTRQKNNNITAPATPEAALWESHKSALKPAYEPILCARKPNDGTFANNAIVHGVSGLNIDGCRVEAEQGGRPNIEGDYKDTNNSVWSGRIDGSLKGGSKANGTTSQGRYPPNLLLECNCGAGQGGNHAPDCVCGMLDADSGESVSSGGGGNRAVSHSGKSTYGNYKIRYQPKNVGKGDSGGASRFYPNLPAAVRFKYSPKAPQKERGDYKHPTVKPLAVISWLCELIRMPEHNLILDPFAGTGTTAIAAIKKGMGYVMIEKEPEYVDACRHRIAEELCQPYERTHKPTKVDEVPKPKQMKLF